MKIALLGYGRMGQEIEKVVDKSDHEIGLIIDSEDHWEKVGIQLKEMDVAIDFSMADVVVDNILRCFDANVPVVVGTCGWLDHFDEIKRSCIERKQALFFAPNFSIGVNIFFDLNNFLASKMAKRVEYEISIEETHHIHKKDAPSGTAIHLANTILNTIKRKDKWVQDAAGQPEELGIKSNRTENVPGTHIIRYESEDDSIEIIHTAKNRKGFAQGAVMAAQFLAGKKGLFGMKELLESEI
ncbi:MAG: 4-hydroxy-tetrahydrodipicolinate reductase [Bacteroidota bacterium]